MPIILRRFKVLLAKINRTFASVLNKLLVIAVGLLVIDVLWGVFSRFVLGTQSAWTEELARFLLIWVALLGMSLAFRQNQHLGVDVLINMLDVKTQKASALFSDLMVLIFAITILVAGGWVVMTNSLNMSQTMIALPFSKATMYSVLPFSGILLCSFTLERLLDNFDPSKQTQSGIATSQADQ